MTARAGTPASVPGQNQAHRDDSTWAKVGPGEYVRSDGTMIRRTIGGAFMWMAYDVDGTKLTRTPKGGTRPIPVGGHSLTTAKLAVRYRDEEQPEPAAPEPGTECFDPFCIGVHGEDHATDPHLHGDNTGASWRRAPGGERTILFQHDGE